jgi:DNA-binding MarR family transcriptional regulator
LWRAGELDANVNAASGTGSAMSPSTSKKRRPVRARKAATSGRAAAVDYETLARFRYEIRKFRAFSEAAANESGLTAQQHQALLAIMGFSRRDGMSIGDLSRYLLIRHHTAVELVDRMARLKVINRGVDAADRRRVLVQLTSEGERRLRRLSKIHLGELRSIGPTLTKMLKLFRRS